MYYRFLKHRKKKINKKLQFIIDEVNKQHEKLFELEKMNYKSNPNDILLNKDVIREDEKFHQLLDKKIKLEKKLSFYNAIEFD